jgi:hypothetical protein
VKVLLIPVVRQIHTISEAPAMLPFVFEDASRAEAEYQREDATFSRVELNTRLQARPFDLRVSTGSAYIGSEMSTKSHTLYRLPPIKLSSRSSMVSASCSGSTSRIRISQKSIHRNCRELLQKVDHQSSKLITSSVSHQQLKFRPRRANCKYLVQALLSWHRVLSSLSR